MVALVGISGLAGLGAATMPASFPPTSYAARIYGGQHELPIERPAMLHATATTTWGQPVMLNCYSCGDGIVCFVIEAD